MSILITRRQTLQSIATATVFASGLGGMVLSLAGCGGEGGGDDTGGSTFRLRSSSVRITVTPPSGGASPTASSLRLWSAGGAGNPAANGATAVTLYNGGPQYVEARDAQGRLVLAGFVGRDRTVLDANSTAETLALFALGVTMLTGEDRSKVFGNLRAANGFNAVATEVDRAIKVDGFVTPDSTILQGLFDAMYAAAGGTGGRRSANATAGLATRGTIVEPRTDASGVAVDTSVDGEVKLTNTRLRRGIAWIDTISHDVDRGFGLTTVEADKSVESLPIPIEIPKRFGGTISTLADWIQTEQGSGSLAYTPTEAGPFPIPAVAKGVEGCKATEYKLTVAGPGLLEGDWAKVGVLRHPQIKRVFFEGFLLDYFLPLFTTVFLPLAGDAVDDFLKYTGGSAILTDTMNTIFSTSPAVEKLISEGKYYDALITLRDAGLLSASLLPALSQMMVDWAEHHASDEIANQASQWVSKAGAILGAIGTAEKWLAIAEAFVVARDFDFSNRGDVLKIKSTGGKVSLVPVKGVLPAHETTNVAAVIQDKNPSAVYKYEWRVSEGFRLNDSLGKTTDDSPDGVLTTSQENVGIESKENEPGVATIRCKVTRVDGQRQDAIDDATGAVTFADGIELSPSPAKVKPGASLEIMARYLGDQRVYWKFELASTQFGTIDRVSVGNNPVVNFKAGSQTGAAVLKVTGYLDAAGTQSIGTLDATIQIGDFVGTPISPSFSYVEMYDAPITQYPTRALYFMSATVPKTAGAIRYNLLRDGQLYSSWAADTIGPVLDPNFAGEGTALVVQGSNWGAVGPVKAQAYLQANYKLFQDEIGKHAFSIVPIFVEE